VEDVERDVVALVRCYANGDRDGLAVILGDGEAHHLLVLITALAAFCNRLGAEQAGGMEAWIDHLGRCLAGAVDSP
jgi:hypothetical protein